MTAAAHLILVAEDNPSDRMLLTALLRGQGYEVVAAADGEEALAQYEATDPSLVLLDVMMPGLDGKETARRIRRVARDRFVPIIFLTALEDPAELAACLEAGGIDFLTKPYQEVVLKAKLNVFLRMAEMQQLLRQQNDEIAGHNRRLLREQEVAKAVFDKIAHIGALDLPNIRFMLSPLAVFNGDVLLAARGPADNLLVLLGDFTGHGLAAGIGAMPLAQTFYSMAAKGFHLRDIARELNDKLHGVLPVGVFCCATLLDFDFNRNVMQCWNGGLPEGVLLHAAEGRMERLVSRHLPLGIRPSRQFDDRVDRYRIAAGDRVLLWSDGVFEALDASGEAFGEDRLLATLVEAEPERWFDEVRARVAKFIGDGERLDDLSLLEVRIVGSDELASLALPAPDTGTTAPQDWRLCLRLAPDSLRHLDPLPLLLHLLMEVPGLRPYSARLFTATSELYNNALEHGLLGLDSSVKDSPAGFSRYYETRERRLAQLDDGWVELQVSYAGDNRGGRLEIDVTDTGAGFDVGAWQQQAVTGGFAGRGIRLLERLGFSLDYSQNGSRAQAVFSWGLTPAMTDE